MELKDFISNTLTQIIDGVVTAQEYAATKNAKINPSNIQLVKGSTNQSTFSDSRGENYAQIVDFDVALSVSDGTKDKGGIGIFSGAINIGGQLQNEQNNSTVSRIKFTVPIFLPNQINK